MMMSKAPLRKQPVVGKEAGVVQALVEVTVPGLHSVGGQQYRRLRRAVYLIRQNGVLNLYHSK